MIFFNALEKNHPNLPQIFKSLMPAEATIGLLTSFSNVLQSHFLFKNSQKQTLDKILLI
jgi:hypothetical protein